MKIKWILALVTTFILAALLAGCGNKPVSGSEASVPAAGQSPAPQSATENAEPDAGNTEPDAEEAASPQDDDSSVREEDMPAETQTAEDEVSVRYYMAANYDIKPIDESDEEKVVLLTFDDGPKEKEMVEKMLEVLDKHEARAIFFVNGYRVEQNPELLVKIHESGQIIGNHAWDHINLKKETEEEVDRQIEKVQERVEELTGSRPAFFRPPFGAANEYVKKKVKEEGMLFMTWSNGSEDWVPKYQNPEGVTRRVLEQLRPGSNILMHELPWTVEALDTLLEKIKKEGYRFVDPRSIQPVDEVSTPTP